MHFSICSAIRTIEKALPLNAVEGYQLNGVEQILFGFGEVEQFKRQLSCVLLQSDRKELWKCFQNRILRNPQFHEKSFAFLKSLQKNTRIW